MRVPTHISVFLIIGLLSTSLTAQDTLKFEVNKHHNILLNAVVNEQDSISLMFHTGVSDVSIIEGSSLSLNWQDVDSVESWGGRSESRVSISNSLRLGDFQWEDVNVWECRQSGPGSDGKIGLSYFSDQHVEFDFEANQLVIHNELPQNISSYRKCPIFNDEGTLFVELSFEIDGELYRQHFLLHSGYGGCLLLDDAFAKENELSDRLEITDQSILKDSYGNKIAVNKAVLPKVVWNNHELENVPVGFFSGEIARQHISVLGADFMRRFQLVLDADRMFVYIKPSKFLEDDYSKI